MQDPRFALMVKPVGAACNLRCAYCYYLKTSIDVSVPRMSYETLEAMIKSYFESSKAPVWNSFTPLPEMT